MKIHSPVKFTGRTEIGPYVLEFVDGVADYDESKHEKLNDGVTAYLTEHGYGLDAEPETPDAQTVEPPDPRLVGDEQVGTRTRDAAVDPRPGDFLPPTNAGEDNPHGSTVVSPEIHASEGVRPVKPGDVHVDDPAKQSEAETAHAAAATDGTPVDDGAPQSPELPEGEPSEKWTNEQLITYAEAHEIDLSGATKKAEYLERIEAADDGTAPSS